MNQQKRTQPLSRLRALPPLGFFLIRSAMRFAFCDRCGCVIYDEKVARNMHRDWHDAVEGGPADE